LWQLKALLHRCDHLPFAAVTMQAFTTSRCSFCRGASLQQARPQARHQAAVSQCVVAKATTKASDFRRLTVEEIDQQVQDAKRSLLIDFRVQQVKSQVGITAK